MKIYVFFRTVVLVIMTAAACDIAAGITGAQAQNEQQSAESTTTASAPDAALKLHHRKHGRTGHVAGASAAQPAPGPDAIKLIIAREAAAAGIPPLLAEAVVQHESRFQVRARTVENTIGLMQIKLGTARAMGFRGDAEGLFKPENNLHFGIVYLGQAYALAHGDTCSTLARYAGGFRMTKVNGQVRAYCSMAKAYMAAHAAAAVPAAAVPALAQAPDARVASLPRN